MAISKVSLSLDADLLGQARARAGRRELSSYVNEAVRRRLQHDRIADLLAEMDEKAGLVPHEILAEARQVWLGDDKPSRRRRTA